MKMQVETIDPEQAAKYLANNTNNRPMRKGLVAQYAKDMRSGNWELTHQGIAFNCDGTLLDGQHRLQAIIETGVTVEMVVSRNLAAKTQLVMDDHAKRGIGDALSLARNEVITQSDVAVIRGAIILGSHNNNRLRPTRHEIDAVIDMFKEPLAFIGEYLTHNERGVTSAPIKASIALAWFYIPDLERLQVFCQVLCGKTLPENAGDRAATMLREWLLRTGMQSSVLRLEGFKKTQRAIIAFLERKDISKLYGTATYYPWPLVDPVRGVAQ